MPKITKLFIDDGGVMNDNALRRPEWFRLVPEFFVPRLGGDPTTWSEANRVVIERLFPFLDMGPQGQDYASYWDDYHRRWLREMAAFAHVDVPVDDAHCLRLAEQADAYITRRVRSAYPGAVEAIRDCRKMGFDLFTSSGGHSRQLDGYLTGMDVRDCFVALYGPDLVNQWKGSAEYYRRIFAHAGVDAKHALVVDDSPRALAWARSAGAATCLVTTTPYPDDTADFVVPRLADLLPALNAFN